MKKIGGFSPNPTICSREWRNKRNEGAEVNLWGKGKSGGHRPDSTKRRAGDTNNNKNPKWKGREWDFTSTAPLLVIAVSRLFFCNGLQNGNPYN